MEASNVKAMREALEKIAHYTDNRDEMDDPGCADGYYLAEIAKTALAAPPRNCDIGTAEEQAERFVEFCDEEKGNREHCRNCRLCNAQDCELAWSQMPYEKGETDGSK